MFIVTSETIAGKPIVESLGLVRGNTIRARHIGRDILAGLRGIVGGEIKDYTLMLEKARDQAVDRMVRQATELGADAIVAVRFTTSQTMSGAAEILAFGTAVRLGNE
jgi:uncharacterized protein YbjQ (UPF0145 family)